MMFNLLDNGKQTLPSVIKDPFLKDAIEVISIYGHKRDGAFKWYGRVEFINGLTKGEQRTQYHEEFDNVLTELKIIFEQIKNK